MPLTTDNAAALVEGATAQGKVLAEILQPCLVAGEHYDPAKPGESPVTVVVSERDLDALVESGRGRRYQAPPVAALEPAAEASDEGATGAGAAASSESGNGSGDTAGENAGDQAGNKQPPAATPPAAQ